MNVVLYLRYSSDKQTEQSIEGQDRVCTEYCRANKMCIVSRYIDRALSASKHTEKREEFLRMIKDSEKQDFDAVIVYKLDRFARNRYDSAIYKNKLKRNGVKVISATENISDSPEGIILESVLEGMAEFYSKELSQKVSRGMNETALKCNSCGGHVPFGYKIENKKFIIDPITAPVAAEAFERYANGETIADLCKDFNRRGIRTSKGSAFNKNSFRTMFKNERYIGTYKYKDIRIESGIPAIITKELYEMVQKRTGENKKAPARGRAKVEYLLAQKLFCGHCGSTMVGESGTSRGGVVHNYYTCSKRKRFHSCDKKNLRKEWIERVVAENALALLTEEKIEEIACIAVKQSQIEALDNTVIPALESEIDAINKKISNVLKLIETGVETESLPLRLKALEEQRADLKIQLTKEMKGVIILEKEPVIWWLKNFCNGDITDINFRRQLIDMLINSVTVWDNPDGSYKITILYNVTPENTQTITCSALQSNTPPMEYDPNELFFYGCVFGYTTIHRVDGSTRCIVSCTPPLAGERLSIGKGDKQRARQGACALPCSFIFWHRL